MRAKTSTNEEKKKTKNEKRAVEQQGWVREEKRFFSSRNRVKTGMICL